MATKVYLSGDNIIVDQDTQPLLEIRADRAMYTALTPFYSDGASLPVVEYIEFKDVHYLTSRTELIANIQDSGGSPFATYFDLIAYLNGFFQRASSGTMLTVPCCSNSDSLTTVEKVADYSANPGEYVSMTTGVTNKVVTFPASPAKDDIIGAYKYDNGAGWVNLDGNGKLINGLAIQSLKLIGESFICKYTGSEWLII